MQTHYYIYKTITSSHTMAKKNEIIVKDVVIKTIKKTADYICITDITRQMNTTEPKFTP